MNISLSADMAWNFVALNDLQIHYRGNLQVIETIADAAAENNMPLLTSTLRESYGHFACLIESEAFVFACVDNCRSTPIFYSDTLVSNSAELIRHSQKLTQTDGHALLDVAMAGYTTGADTIFSGLKQLQSGEFLFWDKNKSALTTGFYYEFVPDELVDSDDEELISQIASSFDNVMQRVIKQADGRFIWVPLSGGLDSRLILSKLVEFGCPNVKAFSYGPAGNDEARSAKNVAEVLGVPWYFVPSTKKAMRKLFASPKRQALWKHANGLNGVPNFQDFLPLNELMEQGIIKKGDIIINGQSGDFITGGHIPAQLLKPEATIDDLFSAILKKHFSLWHALKTPENIAIIKSRVFANLSLQDNDKISPQELASAYELSEYQERQSKFVVNGQRVYDFLGLDWFLPLWDPEFVEVWRNIPAERKIGQKLFKEYLQIYNYQNLFANFKPCLDGWPGLSKLVLPFARLIRWTFGIEWRDKYLKTMTVFGMYSYLYAPYPLWKNLLESQNYRNPISLFTRTWLIENNLSIPDGLK